MTEPDAPAADDTQVPEREIVFKGRTIWVRLPSPEQLLVWKRTVTQLQGADVGGWNGEQVMAALERAHKIIESVILHQADKNWLDDEMLSGGIGLKDTSEIITLTVQAFAPDENRAERRATKKAAPAKRASRKRT